MESSGESTVQFGGAGLRVLARDLVDDRRVTRRGKGCGRSEDRAEGEQESDHRAEDRQLTQRVADDHAPFPGCARGHVFALRSPDPNRPAGGQHRIHDRTVVLDWSAACCSIGMRPRAHTARAPARASPTSRHPVRRAQTRRTTSELGAVPPRVTRVRQLCCATTRRASRRPSSSPNCGSPAQVPRRRRDVRQPPRDAVHRPLRAVLGHQVGVHRRQQRLRQVQQARLRRRGDVVDPVGHVRLRREDVRPGDVVRRGRSPWSARRHRRSAGARRAAIRSIQRISTSV